MSESSADPDPEHPSAAHMPLTTGALARRLGVAPTTLRSWERRYGIGPAVRAEGRHRRWAPGDVAVLEEMCRLTSSGVPPAEAARVAKGAAGSDPGPAARTHGSSRAAGTLPLGDVRQECRGLARAAVRLDAPAVERQLADAVGQYGVVVAWQEVMVPTLHAVGRKWASSGDRYVEVEHLLSWHVSTALRRRTPPSGPRSDTPPSGPRSDTPPAGPVMLACVPGEQHTLPIEALNAALGELGLPTRMFGAAVPVEALTAAVRRLGPAVVVLWAQARSTANLPLARHIADTRWGVKGARRQPALVLAGPGWSGPPVRGAVRPVSLQDAVEIVAGTYGVHRAGR